MNPGDPLSALAVPTTLPHLAAVADLSTPLPAPPRPVVLPGYAGGRQGEATSRVQA